MRTFFHPFLLLFGVLNLAACTPQEREVILLTTNDIHAHIERFPQLATAVERCRDTAEVILIDAGDRWTGNAYVDLAEDRRPIIELMNLLEYDLATLGNHEFDCGQEMLERSVSYADFPIICANISSNEKALLRPFESTRIMQRGGIRLGFAGVVTNYGPNNHPDGHDHIFEGLTFADAVATAAAREAELREESDVTVALTHMGLARDRELAAVTPDYDLIIGSHSHNAICEEIAGVQITQAGKNLEHVGVTTIRLNAQGEATIECRLVSLEAYEPHPDYTDRVKDYENNPELLHPIGELAAPASRIGLANLFAQSVCRAAEAEIGLYHYGGVRLDTLAAGRVPLVSIYDLDPFASQVCVTEMTPEELRQLIRTKFNDTVKMSESHTIDLFATVPYTVLRDERGDARTVCFPTLEEGRTYRVALGDYIYKTYGAIDRTKGETLPILVTDALIATLEQEPYTPQNSLLQQIE